MSDLNLSQDARLTDDLERQLLRGAMEEQSAVHPLATLKSATAAFVNFIVAVNAAMNRARADNAYYSVSQQ